MQQQDTIAAIATARGRAALAIVRVSGLDAIPIVNQAFRGKNLSDVPSHTVHVGHIVTKNKFDIDHVVVTVFRSPHSATGEDIVEISCHGGDFAPQLILQTLLENGARMASPGEFTQRAFLNGKLDLAQAEAVADLIHASSSMAHRVSLNHLQGHYSEQISMVREELLELVALIELELDFAEEDVEFADKKRLLSLLVHTESLLLQLVDSYRVGAFLRDGIKVVIGGKPNAGKSTLLNALIEKDRAIVSPIAGTTRDEIEVDIEIGGFLFKFIDTAGLRETTDLIEAEGVKRAEKSIQKSDVLLYVFDASIGLAPDELAFLHNLQLQEQAIQIILVGNKTDLVSPPFQVDESVCTLPIHWLSANTSLHQNQPMVTLRNALLELVGAHLSDADSSTVVINLRHRQHLSKALEAVQAAHLLLQSNTASGDTLALDLRIALHELGAIVGAITTEDVLGAIFSRFCIGK